MQYKKLSGKDKIFERKGDSGGNLQYVSCDVCPTIMYVDAEAFAGVKIVKGGTVDDRDAREAAKPGLELYTKERHSWCPAWPCDQKETQ